MSGYIAVTTDYPLTQAQTGDMNLVVKADSTISGNVKLTVYEPGSGYSRIQALQDATLTGQVSGFDFTGTLIVNGQAYPTTGSVARPPKSNQLVIDYRYTSGPQWNVSGSLDKLSN